MVITSLALRIFYGYPWATLAVRIPNALILAAVNTVLLRALRRYNLARPVGRLSGLDSRIEVFPTVLLALPDADLADAAAESARTRTELGLYERPEGADTEAGEGEA